MRSWLNDAPNYMPPVPLGGVIRAFAVGKVIESNHSDSEKGETVCGLFDWQQLAVSNGSDVMRKVTDTDLSPSLALGLLGLNGITLIWDYLTYAPHRLMKQLQSRRPLVPWFLVLDKSRKSNDCRTVGITVRPEKVNQCMEEFNYDFAVDYKNSPDLKAELTVACPDGVDIYFDNTCGSIRDEVFEHLALAARITVCGTTAIQEWDSHRPES